jgi:mannitol-1-phosphate 5-dehydrogenase
MPRRLSTGVIFGAGSVGRGFLGQLFCESGLEVVFVDIDGPLVDALCDRGGYQLRLQSNESSEELTIAPVRAVRASETAQIATQVAMASVMATAVGARALADIARPIAVGLIERWQTVSTLPVNVIVCENLHGAPGLLKEKVREQLPARLKTKLDDRVGFVPAVIARMSPAPTAEQRKTDPTLIVAEPYKVLPIDRGAVVGEFPALVGIVPVSRFAAYVERKLFIHNAAHAVLGYLGYKRRHVFGYEALQDPWVRSRLDSALNESAQALVCAHGFDAESLAEHVQDVLERLANRALADPISRLCRDPLRKLAPDDRLVGAARLAEAHGIRPVGLSWGIAGALTYDDPNDAHSAELQGRLSAFGLQSVLQDICGIGREEPLASLVRDNILQLKNNQFGKDDHGWEIGH